MRDLLTDLVQAAAGRADYVDARFVVTDVEELATRNGAVEDVERSSEAGVGVRVRVGGAWGFAATSDFSRAACQAALARALEIARAQPGTTPRPLAPEPPAHGEFASPCERDPFEVSLDDKLAVLLAADEALRSEGPIAVTSADFGARRDVRLFASSEGALCEQRTVECGGGIQATAVSDASTQRRSYPGAHRGGTRQAGWEAFEALDLVGNAPRVAAEAAALLAAPPCPAGETTLVLSGEQLALQVHESVGHAIELDRVLGREASYAGTSFLSPADLGSLRYGSELMQVHADATLPGALGSFGWDDEGVAAQRTDIVRDGVLRGFLTSRETAPEIGLARSGGCMRADGFARQPIVRMTNVSLEPGDAGSLDDLIADTGHGIYMETNRSWSIDSRRLHFQFATEAAWAIEDGRLGRLLRDPSYAGVTPRFWGSLDAICSAGEWRPWAVTNCGKGEPGQTMRVSHGAAPARFRDVQAGIA